MLHILKRLAVLLIPVYLWFAFFLAFEPNNYFGLKKQTDSSQPVARVRAYQQEPGRSLIIGDSRLAHFDMDLVEEVSGRPWQNLAFQPAGKPGSGGIRAGFRPRGGGDPAGSFLLHRQRRL